MHRVRHHGGIPTTTTTEWTVHISRVDHHRRRYHPSRPTYRSLAAAYCPPGVEPHDPRCRNPRRHSPLPLQSYPRGRQVPRPRRPLLYQSAIGRPRLGRPPPSPAAQRIYLPSLPEILRPPQGVCPSAPPRASPLAVLGSDLPHPGVRRTAPSRLPTTRSTRLSRATTNRAAVARKKQTPFRGTWFQRRRRT